MKKNNPKTTLEAGQICFGLSRKEDERSLEAFLRKYTEPRFLDVLLPRLSDKEITDILDLLTALMQKHLKENEYHRLFLSEES